MGPFKATQGPLKMFRISQECLFPQQKQQLMHSEGPPSSNGIVPTAGPLLFPHYFHFTAGRSQRSRFQATQTSADFHFCSRCRQLATSCHEAKSEDIQSRRGNQTVKIKS